MAGINPFAGKKKDEQLELNIAGAIAQDDVMEGHGLNFMGAMIAALDSVKSIKPRRSIMARCGGLFKRNSIKQRTRLNRDRRNRGY